MPLSGATLKMDFDQTPRTEPATVEYYDDFTGYLNSDNESDEDEAARGVENLLTPMNEMSAAGRSETKARRARVYGKQVRSSRPGFMIGPPSSDDSSSSLASLASATPAPPSPTAVVAAGSSVAASSSSSSLRLPLAELSETLSNVHIGGEDAQVGEEPLKRVTRSGGVRDQAALDPRLEWLAPLLDAFQENGNQRPTIQKWADLLDPSWPMKKIAESSFAEVYRVFNPYGTSIIKLMALRPPTGPGAKRSTAATVADVISEVMIMDAVTEIPGMVVFKGIRIIEGQPMESVVDAWEARHNPNDDDEEATTRNDKSAFPHPKEYHKSQVFLVMELGDAGTDIEHFRFKTYAQVWDTFIGAVVALSTAEKVRKFEHRDLHEGNICVRQVNEAQELDWKADHKFGYSGLQVTLLDYTLSRCKTKDGQTMYLDLEDDLTLFHAGENLQSQMYQRMRTWLFLRKNMITHPALPLKRQLGRESWSDFIPYTNVIWLHYVLDYIIGKYTTDNQDGLINVFKGQVEELGALLNPEREPNEGGFISASEVFWYCCNQGWLYPHETCQVEEEENPVENLHKSRRSFVSVASVEEISESEDGGEEVHEDDDNHSAVLETIDEADAEEDE